ncbi:DNA repair protein endonuclease SAE2/CtIP C-terminus-domain-containing protein [Roridomyces roridus]|uniref:DNA repair protein endonuclease SAE2/CtIP C-terminus-domain-containing protein n=1 Tax=Roridomyces roridus TaxID=1738132 RepID=A0AAD7CER1_9AGAR|nr:DNA repair protein endonuclease SAE2/CtIP C-terminus-domain-containing protein [Roridomyces roridus]
MQSEGDLRLLQQQVHDLERQLTIRKEYADEQRDRALDNEARARKLANSMGFVKVDEAQSFFDSTPDRMSYKQLVTRVEDLETRVALEHGENTKLRAQVQDLQRRPPTHDASILKQLQALQHRYDELKTVKERAEEKYMADYRKFDAWKQYLRTDEILTMENRLREESTNLTSEERKARRAEIASVKAKKIRQLEAAELHETTPTLEQNKENQRIPVPAKRRVSARPASQSSSKATTPLARISAVSSTPSATISRVPASIDDAVILIPSSSDTEEDPLVPFPPIDQSPAKVTTTSPPPQRVEASHNSSDTEDDSQDPYPLIKCPPAPVSEDHKHTPVIKQEDRKPLVFASTPQVATPVIPAQDASGGETSSTPRRADIDGEPPLKMRRISMPPGGSPSTPLYVGSGDTPPKKREKPTVSTNAKGKMRELKLETVTPVSNAHASSSKQLTDYSAFKGRGRYGRSAGTESSTINAQFAIDPARNGGKDFQYEQVVRGKEDRRHLEGGDCECCRDYYDAMAQAPLPRPLQPPLWRTPPESPSGKKEGESSKSAGIASHKQNISRHRQQWARPKTPPSYWCIGFPNTQEAADINERAREMHKEKEAKVQEEANREGGRYKKR